MADTLLRASLLKGQISVMLASTRNLAEEAKSIHSASYEAAAALGRAMTGALLLRQMQKEETETLSVVFRGGGIAGTLIATSRQDGVKGYIENPLASLPLKNGKLDVGGIIGDNGTVSVLRDYGKGSPQTGISPLISGEIADDLALYLQFSEQQGSAIALGVLLENNHVTVSGGMLVTPMPGTPEEDIARLEAHLNSLPPITEMFLGKSPKEVLAAYFSLWEAEIYGEKNVYYKCDCSRQRTGAALFSLPASELREMLLENKPVEIACRFCNKTYEFGKEDILAMLEKKESKPEDE